MKHFLCWLGKHTFQENIVYDGDNKWKKQVKCVKCGFIREEIEFSYGKLSKRSNNKIAEFSVN